jgi:hypothetical protein
MRPVTKVGFGGVVAVLLAGCATAPAAPAAALPAAPVPAAADHRDVLTAKCANAADTMPWLLAETWADGEGFRSETEFRPNGIMVYAYGGETYDNGRWSIAASALKMDTNAGYAVYDGTFDGAKASGTMKNREGETGTWLLTKDCAS